MSLMLRFIPEENKENLALEIMIAMLFMARMKKESVYKINYVEIVLGLELLLLEILLEHIFLSHKNSLMLL